MYDYLFVTHLPSLYKVNLFNQLAKRLKIYVIFIGASSVKRTSDFISNDYDFEYGILFEGDFEFRKKILTIVKLIKIISNVSSNKVVIGGWDLLEFWLTLFLNNKLKNALIVESTIIESSTSWIKSKVKKFFLSRISLVFYSGNLHLQLLEALDYKGDKCLTGGVGIFNRLPYNKTRPNFSRSFLYVGRLSQEKNLQLLIAVFNRLPYHTLTIVGSGPLDDVLKKIASNNITFKAHVPNREIANVYLAHDVFILPSLREPWGLVVEEALYYGLPVIVSTHVGCYTELVDERSTGFTFAPQDGERLLGLIHRFSLPQVFNEMKKNVALIDFPKREETQILAYVACRK